MKYVFPSFVMKCLFPFFVVLAASFPGSADAQSFDCGKAKTNTELAICSNSELGRLDENLATLYSEALDSAKGTPENERIQHLQRAWLQGRRDRCGGNVSCLTNAYHTMLAALQGQPSGEQPDAKQQAEKGITPDCSDGAQAGESDPVVAEFAKVVCGDDQLLEKARQVDRAAGKLRDELPATLRSAFDAQQAAFPRTPYMCDSDVSTPLARCVSTAIDDRLKDMADLAKAVDGQLPQCASSQIAIKDSDMGDGGMSQSLDVYHVEYSGTQMCVLHGYPNISVVDGKDQTQPDYADYSGSTYFSNVPTPPLPVPLSPDNKTAWFAIHTAGGCDPGKGPFKVKVAIPHSQAWLRTLDYPDASCPKITVTPIAAISTVWSLIF